MQSIIQSDIFFFITTVVVVVIAIALLILITYGILILRQIKKITNRVKTGVDDVAEDLESIRPVFRDPRTLLISFIGSMVGVLGLKKIKRRRSDKKGK